MQARGQGFGPCERCAADLVPETLAYKQKSTHRREKLGTGLASRPSSWLRGRRAQTSEGAGARREGTKDGEKGRREQAREHERMKGMTMRMTAVMVSIILHVVCSIQ